VYKAGFDKAYADAVNMLNKAVQENKSIYYDSEVPVDEINKPDPKNFVSCISIADEINGNSHLDESLRHLVPPAVKEMQNELGKILQ
jgi:hypothetical protein